MWIWIRIPCIVLDPICPWQSTQAILPTVVWRRCEKKTCEGSRVNTFQAIGRPAACASRTLSVKGLTFRSAEAP